MDSSEAADAVLSAGDAAAANGLGPQPKTARPAGKATTLTPQTADQGGPVRKSASAPLAPARSTQARAPSPVPKQGVTAPLPPSKSDAEPVQQASIGARRAAPKFQMKPFTDMNSNDSANSSDEELSATTPNLAETSAALKRSLSIKNLKDLDVKDALPAVWRKPGEGRKRPKDLEQLLIWSLRGGLRAFLTGYSLRSGVNLVMVLFGLMRNGKFNLTKILNSVFGIDAFRMGAMFGSFAFLFKSTNQGLRIYNPGPRGPGKEEIWHAALAGAVSGVAVLAEKKQRRLTFAQQLFVRGLQGLYNIGKSRGMPIIPHGDVLLFGLACGQIMYGWMMSPESLAPGYRRWITMASRVSPPALPVNLAIERNKPVPTEDLEKLLRWPGITPKNKAILEGIKAQVNDGQVQSFLPCAGIHPWIDTCTMTQVERWISVFRWMLPVYSALHFIPPVLLKRKAFAQDPFKFLSRSAIGTFRSCSFLGTFVIIFQGLVCLSRNLQEAFLGKFAFLDAILGHRYCYWGYGFATSAAMFIEEKRRRGELAMYVLPRALESVWSVARSRSWVPLIPGGEVVLTSTGLAMVMSAYHHDPARLSGLVRMLLYQFIGRS
ncbi:hypothetical protein E5Q_04443 [Mixia osmundae IAM 14324]|uniref:Transmembrane protein 135 N-terminal domain-containing protein n=2 Tax=Mixia osmundae (strain CBS 9802 / IAM 14324 / JCM 22182 / KY 12970) TaxID=764103 RepID=G7E4K4_MIXOS|nr:hypothetical protein E5Q_04443 [Mixia osmundae IAM 14324]